MISSFSFQSCQEATAPHLIADKNTKPTPSLQKKQGIELNDLDLLAKQLAIVFKKKILRKVLKHDAINAITREHILDAKAFFEKKRNIQGKAITFKNMLLTQSNKKKIKDELNHIFSILKKGEIDIYFPVHTHLEHFDINKNDLKIGYINPNKEWAPVNVYTLTGRHELLDSHQPPAEPVLMINYCEHYGKHNIKNNKHDITPGQTIEGGGDGGGGGGGGGTDSGSGHPKRKEGDEMILQYVKQSVCEDPWGSGDPEIYYSIKGQKGYKKENIYLGDKWDCINNIFYSKHDYNWKTVNKYDAQWYFDTYGNYMVYYFYESDGNILGGIKKITFSISYTNKDTGITTTTSFEFTIALNDDSMGNEYVDKRDTYREKSHPYDTGKIQFIPNWETIQ